MKLFILLASVCAIGLAAVVPDHAPFTHEIIDYVNTKPGNTWQAGVNTRFIGIQLDQFKRLLGAKRVASPHAPRLPEAPKLAAVGDIPDTFDSRAQWPNCPTVSEIRDQCSCGSCWAFAAVESMSDRICIASNAKYTPRLSSEDMNSCCDTCGDGCNGGFPSAAWQYWQDTGVVTGGNYTADSGCLPYALPPCDHHVQGKYKPCGSEQPTPKCVKQCKSGYNKEFSEDKWYGQSAYHVSQDVEAIQREIMTNGPVEVDFTVYADFPSYKSGVYQHTSGSALGGHAVRMLGWGTENGTPYWLIANSWNTDWGADGLFKIIRGQNECGIEEDVNGGLPKLP